MVISRQLFDPALPPEQRRQLQEEQLKPLQQLVTEAAAAYYTAAGARLRQKQLDLSSTLGSCPPDINAATAFKVRSAVRCLWGQVARLCRSTLAAFSSSAMHVSQ